MVLMSHIMVPTSHMMVLTITLLGTLNFYLLFKFNIYKKTDSTSITYDDTYIYLKKIYIYIYDDTYIIFDGTN